MSETAAPIIERVPLRVAVLCLDCERIFAIGPSACPACAGRQWIPLAQFFRPSGHVALEDVLHHAGNALTPARVRAERLVETLSFYVKVGFARNPEFLELAVQRAQEVIDAIDATMARLRALAPPSMEGVIHETQ